jgi:hypothetical protein
MAAVRCRERRCFVKAVLWADGARVLRRGSEHFVGEPPDGSRGDRTPMRATRPIPRRGDGPYAERNAVEGRIAEISRTWTFIPTYARRLDETLAER